MAFIKNQSQTINGTEYNYKYIYQSYYEPGMDNPTNFKIGKVGDSADDLASSFRSQAESRDLDISEEEIQNFQEEMERIKSEADSDEEIAEKISEEEQDIDEEDSGSEECNFCPECARNLNGEDFCAVHADVDPVDIDSAEEVYREELDGIHPNIPEGLKEKAVGMVKAGSERSVFQSEPFTQEKLTDVDGMIRVYKYIEENQPVNSAFIEEDDFEKTYIDDDLIDDALMVLEEGDFIENPEHNTYVVNGYEGSLDPTNIPEDRKEDKSDYQDLLSQNVPEVKDDIESIPVRDYPDILEEEKNGKDRKTVKKKLENALDDAEEASDRDIELEINDFMRFIFDDEEFDTEKVDEEKLVSSVLSEGRSSYPFLEEEDVRRVLDDLVEEDNLERDGNFIKPVEHDIPADDPAKDNDFDSKEAVKQLTSEGAIVGKDVADEMTRKDLQLIQETDPVPMYINTELMKNLRSGKDVDVEYSKVEFLGSVPEFTGTDGEVYGGYSEGDIAELPWGNAEILVNRGTAEMVEENTRSEFSPGDSDVDSAKNGIRFVMQNEGSLSEEELKENTDIDGEDVFELALSELIEEDKIHELSNRDILAWIGEGSDKSAEDWEEIYSENEEDNELDRLRELIHDLDDGEGADFKEVVDRDWVNEDLIDELMEAGEAYEPVAGKIKLLDFTKSSDEVGKEEVFSKVNDRDYSKHHEGDEVFAFNHEETGKDIWFEGKESSNSDDYIIYGDIVSVLKDEGVIDADFPEMHYDDKEEALDELRLMTMDFKNNFEDYLDEYKDEEDLERKDMNQLKDKVVDFLDENQTSSGDGVKYEDLRDNREGIGNWMEINGFTEDMLEDAINELLSEGTLYEPRPGHVKKL